MFVVFLTIHFALPIVSWEPDPESPIIHSTHETYFTVDEFDYEWKSYETNLDVIHSGWYKKNKIGHWCPILKHNSERILGIPKNIIHNFGQTVGHLFITIVLASFIGLWLSGLVAYIIQHEGRFLRRANDKEKYVRSILIGFIVFALIAIIKLSSSQTNWRPDPDRPIVHYTHSTFFKKVKIDCSWEKYDEPNDYGWCDLTPL